MQLALAVLELWLFRVCLFCVVDYHNYFTTVHLLMKTRVA